MKIKQEETGETLPHYLRAWNRLNQTRSENGYGLYRCLKTNVENDIFWFEIGTGFGELGGTAPPRIHRSTPSGGQEQGVNNVIIIIA